MIYRDSIGRPTAKSHTAPQRLRLGTRTLTAILAMTTLALVVASVMILTSLLPAQAAAQPTPEQFPKAIAAVEQRFTGQVADPLVEVSKHIQVRESNLRGIIVDGTTYFYAVQGHQSFDPLSMGKVGPEQIKVIYQTEGVAFPIVIYYIPGQ